MNNTDLILPLPDPWLLPNGEQRESPDLEGLLTNSPQYRELCKQVATIMALGNKTIRVAFVTTLELMYGESIGGALIPDFLPDDDEEGGVR